MAWTISLPLNGCMVQMDFGFHNFRIFSSLKNRNLWTCEVRRFSWCNLPAPFWDLTVVHVPDSFQIYLNRHFTTFNLFLPCYWFLVNVSPELDFDALLVNSESLTKSGLSDFFKRNLSMCSFLFVVSFSTLNRFLSMGTPCNTQPKLPIISCEIHFPNSLTPHRDTSTLNQTSNMGTPGSRFLRKTQLLAGNYAHLATIPSHSLQMEISCYLFWAYESKHTLSLLTEYSHARLSFLQRLCTPCSNPFALLANGSFMLSLLSFWVKPDSVNALLMDYMHTLHELNEEKQLKLIQKYHSFI